MSPTEAETRMCKKPAHPDEFHVLRRGGEGDLPTILPRQSTAQRAHLPFIVLTHCAHKRAWRVQHIQ